MSDLILLVTFTALLVFVWLVGYTAGFNQGKAQREQIRAQLHRARAELRRARAPRPAPRPLR